MHAHLKFLWPYVRSQRGKLSLAFVLATFSVALDHFSPWILKWVIDGITHQQDLPTLWKMIALGACAVVLSGIFGYVQRMLTADFSRNLEAHLRDNLFERILGQDRKFFQHHLPGELLQNLVQDLDRIQELTGPALLHFYRTALTLIFSSILLYLLSPTLAFLGIIFFLVLAIASLRLIGLVYQGHRRSQAAQATLSGFIRDFLHGVPVVKASGSGDYFAEQFTKASGDVRQQTLSIAKLSASIWPSITLICGIGIAVAIAWGSVLVQRGSIGAGTLAAVTLYLVRAQYPLVGLGIMAAMVQRGRASLDRVLDLIHGMKALLPVSIASPPPFDRLEFRNLQFQFADAQSPCLIDIQFELTPGRTLGIVGDTGSGKTTLARLACGILSVPPGFVFLNDQDLHDLQSQDAQGEWRQLIAYAPQDGFLFSWSIRDNIALGAEDPEEQAIELASERSGLGRDLHLFPQGLDAVLGEKGVNLSGGQRQRVGLARAFLSNAPLLILDEVMSAVDPETERLVLASLRHRHKDQAMMIISHRYACVQECDEILYMEQGRIVERGTHDSLLALQGRYARSWATQCEGMSI